MQHPGTLVPNAALRDLLERWQIAAYFCAAVAGMMLSSPEAAVWGDAAITPALALMLFVTFMQLPLARPTRQLMAPGFVACLLVVNFLVLPVLILVLLQVVPADPLVRLGFLLVMLTPCIDYVVTFSQVGGADSRRLVAATPILLIVQMLMLPVYLRLFLGEAAADAMQPEPFVEAFIWLIAVPLLLAAVVQRLATTGAAAARAEKTIALLPVPSTALVLFIITLTVAPRLEAAADVILQIVPLYVAFAICAPAIGWAGARLFRLPAREGRAVAFSAGTRNSLVVLPLAVAVPGALPLLPAVVVAQTLVELAAQLVYIRVMPYLGGQHDAA